MHCCLHGKAKNKKKLEVALSSAMIIALGKENLKKKQALPSARSLALSKEIFKKNKILC
jgi:hypothetical protein